MTLEQWSVAAEISSSVVIAVTLVYLVIQTRQNASAIQANSRHIMIETDVQLLVGNLTNPPIAMYKKDASDSELMALESYLVALVRTREHQWFQFRKGLLDRQAFEAYLSGLTANLCQPRTRKWWEHVKYSYFDNEFVAEVSPYISGAPVSEDPRPTMIISDELSL